MIVIGWIGLSFYCLVAGAHLLAWREVKRLLPRPKWAMTVMAFGWPATLIILMCEVAEIGGPRRLWLRIADGRWPDE